MSTAVSSTVAFTSAPLCGSARQLGELRVGVGLVGARPERARGRLLRDLLQALLVQARFLRAGEQHQTAVLLVLTYLIVRVIILLWRHI